MVKIKRVYDPPSPSDGRRILVDRLWPRGLSRKRAAIDQWAKDLAPSDEIRCWFSHDPKRWAAFQLRYRAELRSRRPRVAELAREAARQRHEQCLELTTAQLLLRRNRKDAVEHRFIEVGYTHLE